MAVRDLAQRTADVLHKLRTDVDLWVASAGADGEAHLVPLSFYWDGARVIIATPARSITARNLRRTGRARVAIGPTRDVVIVDGTVSEQPVDADPTLAIAHAQPCRASGPRRYAGRAVAGAVGGLTNALGEALDGVGQLADHRFAVVGVDHATANMVLQHQQADRAGRRDDR
jgi:Pyridoxamine 5'-phosphate oxidase